MEKPNLEELQEQSQEELTAEQDVRNDAVESAVEDAMASDNIEENDTEAEESVEEAGVEEEPSEPTPEEIIAQLREELAASEARVGEQMDKLQRTAAEFQNSKRRQEKQLADQIQRASLHAVEKILPVLDDLELAYNNMPDDIPDEVNAWLGGFQQIQNKLLRILEDQEVVAIESEGPFDPNRHDAISSEESDEVESDHIIETLRTGYECKGRILRPAMVRVAA